MTPEQLAKRRIGGSSIAAILRKSKWKTALDVYLDLTAERPQQEKTGPDIERGRFLEPAIRDWVSSRLSESFLPSPQLVHREWDWATVNPDGISVESRDLLEIKAPRRDDAAQWGEEGSDEVPDDAFLQTAWGCLVANARGGVVAALLGGELRIYRVARDRDLEAKMLARAKQFVEQHVIPRIPPPAEYGDDANVLYLHPRNLHPPRQWSTLTTQEQIAVCEYVTAYRSAKELEKTAERWEPVLKEIIGDTDGIQGMPPEVAKRIDWKCNATAGTKWKELVEANIAPELIEEWKPKHAAAAPRVFRPWFTTEKKR